MVIRTASRWSGGSSRRFRPRPANTIVRLAPRGNLRPMSDRRPLRGSVAKARHLLRLEAPAHGPVLGLHLVAPAQCSGPIAEVSIPERTAVDEPNDNRSVRARANHSMTRQPIGPPHSPEDGRLVIHNSLGHASLKAKVIPAMGPPFPRHLHDAAWRMSQAGRQR